jgi:hypothetical protein
MAPSYLIVFHPIFCLPSVAEAHGLSSVCATLTNLTSTTYEGWADMCDVTRPPGVDLQSAVHPKGIYNVS